MKKIVAEFISIVLHPIVFSLLMPLIVVYRQTTSGYYALKWTLFSAFFVFIGVLILLIARSVGVFSDFDISKKEERPLFYYITLLLAIIYFLVAVTLKGIFFPLSLVAFGIVLALIVFRIVNSYIKASIHLAVACSFMLTVSLLYRNPFLWFLIAALGALVWSRWALKRHTLQEMVIGGGLGIIITLITFLVATVVI